MINYIEVTTEEAIEILKKSQGKKVVVAIYDLEHDELVSFCPKLKKECETMISDAKTIASNCDDFVKQLRLFTEKQDIRNILPRGVQKTILIR